MNNIKGIVLAGGMGSRLAPLTRDNNKHALAVYDKIMLEYPIRSLVQAGITEIILITGGKKPGQFLEYFKTGQDFGITKLYYTVQEGAGGIADALKLARNFLAPQESCVVMLGDNYFEDGITAAVDKFKQTEAGATVVLKQVQDPWYFGVAEVQDDVIVGLEEKPAVPKSDLAVLGCYVFDHTVWSHLDQIKPSQRGELEITDLLKCYLPQLQYVKYTGYWSDMGTFKSLSDVSARVGNIRNIKTKET